MATDTNLTLLALELSARIIAGEKVPLDELREFILASHLEIKGERKKKESGEKDVSSFF